MIIALKILWLAWLSGEVEIPDFPTREQLALLYPNEDPEPRNIHQIVFD